MNPPPATLSSPAHHLWRTPIPYLFGGLAAVLVLISVALFMLACSYLECHPMGGDNEEEVPKKSVGMVPPDAEPRMVVIMAGEDVPSHIAIPRPKTSALAQNCCCDQV
ncbi:hypothetical protein MLD38_013147 [Melastoma candidum]|uniref:Uncharacterized protein n=1 Tax=Melastoma candidum TaxID=119954 RepID=A0ACB9R8P8_9MYRT|nr:hypothetical protein MLD38_013147 [Melastoma candidum]